MVMVHDPDNPRGFWKLAKVESLITSKDEVVRGAVLKVGSKSGPPTTLQDPYSYSTPWRSAVSPQQLM